MGVAWKEMSMLLRQTSNIQHPKRVTGYFARGSSSRRPAALHLDGMTRENREVHDFPIAPLVAVVGQAGLDGVGAVELLERDDEREFVLQRELAQRPRPPRGLSHIVGVPVGAANEQGEIARAVLLPCSDLLRQLATGDVVTAFVEDDAQHALAALQESAASPARSGGL